MDYVITEETAKQLIKDIIETRGYSMDTQNNNKYISIREKRTHKIVKSINVTGQPERRIEKTIKGLKYIIDHSKHYINGVR